jgi:hypothetical protein
MYIGVEVGVGQPSLHFWRWASWDWELPPLYNHSTKHKPWHFFSINVAEPRRETRAEKSPVPWEILGLEVQSPLWPLGVSTLRQMSPSRVLLRIGLG